MAKNVRTQKIVTVRGQVNDAMKQEGPGKHPTDTMSGIQGNMGQTGASRTKKQAKSINAAMGQGG